MGLIDRVRTDQFDSLIGESEAASESELRAVADEALRIEAITNHLEVVAARLEEPLQMIATRTPVGLPLYCEVGGVVLMVQRFMAGNQLPDPTKPHLVTLSHCTYMLALNRGKVIVPCKIGTLRFLDYRGIARVIADAPADYVFDAAAVRIIMH